MARPFRLTLLIAAVALVASPAVAQLQIPNIFDTLFGPPPRPPANVPQAEPRYDPPPPPGYPRSDLPPERLLPPGSPPRPRDNVQTQPLPPPPGATAAPQIRQPLDTRLPQDAQLPVAPAPGLPGGQRPPMTPTSLPQPNDEVITPPPSVKIVHPTAVFSGLDKITGRITAFEVAINETVRFGALEVTPRACYTRPPTETANTDGFIEVDELTLQGELRRIFTGWMYAASPGLNAVEHPIYDVWLTDCKGGEQAPSVEVTPDPPAATQRPAQRQPPRRQPPPQRRAQPLPPPPAR